MNNMRPRKGKSNKFSGHRDENEMLRRLDDLSEFERFKTEILPKLRRALEKGKGVEDIYKLVAAEAAARAVTLALTEPDSGKALSAIKEILDRSGGKATDRKEITQKYEKLSDTELDALLSSQLTEVASDEDLPN
jgi:hypothetical protein